MGLSYSVRYKICTLSWTDYVTIRVSLWRLWPTSLRNSGNENPNNKINIRKPTHSASTIAYTIIYPYLNNEVKHIPLYFGFVSWNNRKKAIFLYMQHETFTFSLQGSNVDSVATSPDTNKQLCDIDLYRLWLIVPLLINSIGVISSRL